MIPHPIAVGLRRDLARIEARIREADHAGRDHLAMALSDEAQSILAEIAAVEGVSVLGLMTERLPMEMLV